MKFVILGGSFAGLDALKSVKSHFPDAEVTLVAAASKFWFNIAAPRLLVDQSSMAATWVDLDAAVKKHNGTFIHDKATSVDFEGKQVSVENGRQSIGYDVLVLATGSRASHAAFKIVDDAEKTSKAVKDLGEEIKEAQDIAIVGAGPTGVETAGEIAHTYRDKKVTLYYADDKPLAAVPQLYEATKSQLENLGVKLVNKAFLQAVEKNSAGKHEMSFKNGQVVTTDLCIKTLGVVPNTEYLDKSVLNEKGFVVTDEYLRVKGVSGVYAFGDVVAIGQQTSMDITYVQSGVLSATLKHDLVSESNALKAYAPVPTNKTTIVVPITRDGGVGLLSGWKLPSFMVKFVKSKTFFVEKVKEFA